MSPATQEPPLQQEENAPQAAEKKDKKREGVPKYLLRVIIALVILAVGIFLILFFVAKAARYDSIGAMLQHMGVELQLMWQRITA